MFTREDMLTEIQVTDNTNNGECSRCGECCNDILCLTIHEILDILRYTIQHNIKPICQAEYDENGELVGLHMQCCFLDKKNHKCLVYNVRPQICRLFKCDQSKEEILLNQEKTYSRKEAYMISTHVTYLQDEMYQSAIANDPKWSLIVMKPIFEEGDI